MKRTPLPQPNGSPYWIEPKRSITFGNVLAYLVVCDTEEEGRVVLRQFRCRGSEWEGALRQAEGLRDALNAEFERPQRRA